MPGPEHSLAEKPTVDQLVALGYGYLPPTSPKDIVRSALDHRRDGNNDIARDGQNRVILRDEFIEAIRRINDVSEDVAQATYMDALNLTSNESWTNILRGAYSRTVPGESRKKTIKLVDFLHPENNAFTVTNQLYVDSESSRIPDMVAYVNGTPLVVIEAKRPFAVKDKSGEAFEQIKQYERDIPRLFHSNVFNIITNGVDVMFGATGAPSAFWSVWKDPWPRKVEDFTDRFSLGLWALLEPSRLLDVLAHFVIFEREESKVVKKMCRYQQYRAVNKIVDRVLDGKHRRGLIWHTQGSGKSLTMAFSVLKLKNHLTIDSSELASPNLLILTDRKDLDRQISNTFRACGLPNPKQMGSIRKLQESIHSGTTGLTLLSTIHKFEGAKIPVENNENWILMVDECHRSQEKDLGAFLRATFPDARFFGFTGTPIKKNDKDTYANFGAPGEGYLDRYSIDDAVADGATVPIRYTSRKADWQVDAGKIDIVFDQWFVNEPEEKVEKLKERGITIADLAKHRERIENLAFDLWTHFKAHAIPDGFKAQVVAIDREAIILYKRALDRVIAEDLQSDGFAPEKAAEWATQMSACVYSSSQEDQKPSEDPWKEDLRQDLVRYLVQDEDEVSAIKKFTGEDQDHEARVKAGEVPPLHFLIVCNKLLTGFDAPIESVMYLDSPLREHALLQAIARTNRVAGPKKKYGLIVDYIGITKKLEEALESYREADVKNAMRDLDVERAELKAAHREIMALVKPIKRKKSRSGGDQTREEYDALVQQLGTEDAWFTFRRKAKAFINAYEALSPDPSVLDYSEDLKWVAGFLHYGALIFEKRSGPDLKDYSAKIREILDKHLHITGLRTICKLRSITDPDFWDDFDPEATDEKVKIAAIRKIAELRKITQEKKDENPAQYGPFSERVLELIRRFEEGQLAAAEVLKETQKIAEDLKAEGEAHKESGLNERAYGLYRILEAFKVPVGQVAEKAESGDPASSAASIVEYLRELAESIDGLYGSDQSAPPGWHLKEQLRKELRQEVRKSANRAGLKDLKAISERVEEFALRSYVKIA